ncbi:hypothetical protein Tco_0207586, partial [Tanacetum coccineum]
RKAANLDHCLKILLSDKAFVILGRVGIEPQFKNIILNGPYAPIVAGVRKPKAQWSNDKRKAANLDHCLKILLSDKAFVILGRGTNLERQSLKSFK